MGIEDIKNLSYKPAGFINTQQLFITVQKEGEGNIDINGKIKKNNGVNAEISLSNTYDPKNRWGITPESLAEYNKQFIEPVNKQKKIVNNLHNKIKNKKHNSLANNHKLKQEKQKLSELQANLKKNKVLYNKISFEIAKKIFLNQYYDKPDFEKLPESIATVASDWGFVCHPRWPTRALAKIVGALNPNSLFAVNEDVIVKTNEYIRKNGEQKLTSQLCDEYQKYLTSKAYTYYEVKRKGKKTFKQLKKAFLKGWTQRVVRIKDTAKNIAKEKAQFTELSPQKIPTTNLIETSLLNTTLSKDTIPFKPANMPVSEPWQSAATTP